MLKKAYRENVAKMLHHSILQLFNDQVTYKSDLQILGVLCLTIDHEEQEILIKVNNTLRKRSSNSAGKVMISLSGQKSDSDRPASPMVLQSSNPFTRNTSPENSDTEQDEDGSEEPTLINNNQQHSTPTTTSSVLNQSVKSGPRILALSEIKAYDNTRSGRSEQKRKQSAPVKITNYREIRPAPPKNDLSSGVTIINVPNVQRHLTAHLQTSENNASNVNSLLPTPAVAFSQQSFFNEFYGGSYEPVDSSVTDSKSLEELKGNGVYKDTKSGFRIKEEPPDDYPSNTNAADSKINHTESGGKDANHEDEDNEPEDLSTTRGSDDQQQDSRMDEDFDGDSDMALKIVSVQGSSGRNSNGVASQEDSFLENNDIDAETGLGDEDDAEIEDENAYVPVPILHRKRKCEEMDSLILEKVDDDNPPSMVVGKRGRNKTQTYEEMISEAASHVKKREDQMNQSEYTCKYCMLVFSDLLEYTQHTITQHRAYLCQLCGKTFTTKSSLFRHRSVHTGQRRFMCALCKKAFYRKDKCRAHIQCKHKIDVNAMYQI